MAISPDILSSPLTILSIDPGTHYTGWAESIVENGKFRLLHYGTIEAKGPDIKSNFDLIEGIKDILIECNDKHNTLVTIEDYVAIGGKTKGMFKVPKLTGALEYLWYSISSKEIHLIPSTSWKSYICNGNSKASKDEIVACLREILPSRVQNKIGIMFENRRGKNKGDFGEQDCYDAIGQNLYVCKLLIDIYNKEEV